MPLNDRVVTSNIDLPKQHLSSDEKGVSIAAKFVGTGATALAETVIFHQPDTIAKRLMKHTGKFQYFPYHNQNAIVAELNKVIFKEAHVEGYQSRFLSLLPGMKWGLIYKLFERVHAFALQPIVAKSIHHHLGVSYQKVFGSNYMDVAIQGTAGGFLGGLQFLYIPFDALKTQAQLAPLKTKNVSQQIKASISFFDIVKQQGNGNFYQGVRNLYKGSLTYVSRTTGSAAILFSTSAIVKQHGYGLADPHLATFSQNFVASSVSAITAVALTNPLDVIKTRIQAHRGAMNGVGVVMDILKHEGLTAFAKGFVPKMLTSSPKIIFTMTLAPYVSRYVDQWIIPSRTLHSVGLFSKENGSNAKVEKECKTSVVKWTRQN